MEATITTTDLTHLPTECVTGLTFCNTMYEICWYEWKEIPARSALLAMAAKTGPVTTAGVSWRPSRARVTGAHANIDIMVMILNRLMLSKSTFFISFLENTLRDVKVTLDPRAAINPTQLKDVSVKEARAIPPTTGMRVATRAKDGMSPRKTACMTTEKNGSHDLMVCVNETATLPRLIFVRRLPRVWTRASGRIVMRVLRSTWGRACRPAAHIMQAMTEPTARLSSVRVVG
mmetsp:Transcript_22668/g.27381  ORF Transcript_22668/g.27381 Transcript_22668/m.27381 type:complete len:232 (-) Transcript_22668:824-1519(-)